ncbi:MAG: C4-type zinc ribbon domain-containing protein [Elusimicrobiota bacterium]
MAISKEDLEKLLLLQEQDNLLDSLRKSIASVPGEIAALRAEIEQENTRLHEIHEKTKRLQADKKEKELAMAEKEEAIKKHQTELNQIKTNEAFKALLKEIDGEKAAVSDFETAILTLMDDADAVLTEEKAVKESLKAFEGERNAWIKTLEDRRSDLEKQVPGAEAKRKEYVGGIREDIVELYDATRERRDGIALARVKGETCSECHMTLPVQVLIHAKKGKLISVCDSCQRILYEIEPRAAEKTGT